LADEHSNRIDEDGGASAAPAGHGHQIDDDPVFRALIEANPWAREVNRSENSPVFCDMRRQASMARYEKGRTAWNEWAEIMLALKRDLEERRLWAFRNTQYRGIDREPHPDSFRAENELTRLWLMLAQVYFTGKFGSDPVDRFKSGSDSFVRFQFPGMVFFYRVDFESQANFTGASFARDVFFKYTTFGSRVDFGSARFSGAAVFHEAKFKAPEDAFKDSAYFSEVEFCRDAYFSHTEFDKPAHFDHCTFRGLADFTAAKFRKECSFSQATFCGIAKIGGASFEGDVDFAGAVFERLADFSWSAFRRDARFSAIQSKSGFSLAGTSFDHLPNFIQSDFKQAPQFDGARFQAPKSVARISSLKSLFGLGGRTFYGDPEDPSLFRALKRLAVQGHDHLREAEFHAGEMKARRGTSDKPFGPNAGAYWFGLLYQATSNFGRSLVRPVAWLAGLLPAFAGLYWALATESEARCSAVTAAAYLSFRKGIALTSLEANEKLKQAYACLYGTSSASPGQATVVPVIPNLVEALTVLQTILSGVLLFLFALALRNHFRIR
jgi:hypothetical protein